MKNLLTIIVVALLVVSCSDTEGGYNAYYNWKERNDVWFMQVLDSARQDIAAKGEESPWRIRRTLLKTAMAVNDTNCVVMKRLGSTKTVGCESPTYTDTVCIAYRGWLMERLDYVGSDNQLTKIKTVMSQTFFGDFDTETAGTVENSVNAFAEGFSTALQYMKSGEMWMVYIPSGMGYGAQENLYIPAYSTLQFFIWMHSWRRTGIPGDM
jgi:FKBP-type peptidyl-prolyl cis-trans isomerase FklB